MPVYIYIAVCQNLVPLVNIKIAGKWMLIPLKMVLIGIDPYPYNIIFQPFPGENGPMVPSLRYSIPFAYRLSGQLHVERLSAAFLALLQRHEALRTVLREEGAKGHGGMG